MPTPLQHLDAMTTKRFPNQPANRDDHLKMSGHAGELDAEWLAEIAQRVADDDAGRTQFMPAQEALNRLGEHIRRRLAERPG